MPSNNNFAQQVEDFLVTQNYHPEMLNADGRPCENIEDAKIFSFDYVGGSGRNYGTMVVVLGEQNEMIIMYGDNLGKSIEDPSDRGDFFKFQEMLTNLARRNHWNFTLQDISKIRHVQAGIAAIKEGLFEGYYGTRKVSYLGEPTDARLMIKHSQPLGETDQRYRHIEAIFIETASGERFKLQHNNLVGARAMLEHVRQGGNPYDIRGAHINEMVTEMKVLARFNRASQGRVMEGIGKDVIENAQKYYQQLRENIRHLATGRGYKTYFESWSPLDVSETEGLVEDIKTLFVEQTLDSRIEAALPVLAKIQQGTPMKEADIFESWVEQVCEGTWALPDNPEALGKLKELMSKELIVGPDGVNATEQLYDIVGDDQLFDRISDLARETNGRANLWDDSEVQSRLQELGVDVQSQGPADEVEPVADTQDTGVPDGGTIAPQAPVAPVQEDLTALEESLRSMLKHAGVTVAESRIIDESGETLEHILDRFKHEVHNFEQGGELDDDLYDALYDYYANSGQMPYGTMKARTGDPYEWITDRLDAELGTGNHAPRLPEADNIATFVEEPLDEFIGMAAVGEGTGTCNMTEAGQYCPEHGLEECGTVAGGMAPVMGEGEMDEAMFPGSAIGNKLRDMKRGFGQTDSLKLAMGMMPAAGAGASAGAAMQAGGAALFAPALGAGALGGAAAALGGFLTYKGLNWLAQKLFGTKEEALEFATAHLNAAHAGQPQFTFQGKTYPVKIKSPEEAQELYYKVKQLRSQVRESDQQAFVNQKHDDPINYNAAATSTLAEKDDPLARIKSLALSK